MKKYCILIAVIAPLLIPRPGSWAAEEVRFAESQGIKLIVIPSGEFSMGSSEADFVLLRELYPGTSENLAASLEQPAHRVKITNLAAMSAHEITVGQFRKFVNETGHQTDVERDLEGAPGWIESAGVYDSPKRQYSWKQTGFPQSAQHPVVNVSWNDAVAYCKWLSRKDGREFRLPTEAEWEYCARAGSTSVFPDGHDPRQLVRSGNVSDSVAKAKLTRYPDGRYEEGSDGFAFTAPVGHLPANRFGLHDMIGNVAEWCSDKQRRYDESAQTDPLGDPAIFTCVTRGGSWAHSGLVSRPAFRSGWSPNERSITIGFRIAQIR